MKYLVVYRYLFLNDWTISDAFIELSRPLKTQQDLVDLKEAIKKRAYLKDDASITIINLIKLE